LLRFFDVNVDERVIDGLTGGNIDDELGTEIQPM
jgi:hypothetical protein